MRQAVLDLWERRLVNWSYWAVSGSRVAVSGAYRGPRIDNYAPPRRPPPVVGEALDTDDLVHKLEPVHYRALLARYVWTGPSPMRAAQLGCSVTAMNARVIAAKFKLDDLWHARRKPQNAPRRTQSSADVSP